MISAFKYPSHVQHDLTNPLGSCHGGSIYSLADVAAGAAAASYGYYAVTVSSEYHYLNSAQEGSEVIATAKAIKSGRSILLLAVNLKEKESGKLLGTAHFTYPNIIALKNSSSSSDAIYVKCCADREFRVLAGTIAKLYDSLSEGAVGGVISTACYLPEECCELFRLYQGGQEGAAKQLWRGIVECSRSGAGSMGVPGVKAAMSLCGFEGGHVRSPLMDLPDDNRAVIASALRVFGRIS